MEKSIEIFCCYAREDQPLLFQLKKHLFPLQRQGLIVIWTNMDVSPGTSWEDDVGEHLDTAQIILLLISPDFVSSDYCYGKEMMQAMKRHEQGKATIIPILLRPVNWQKAPFSMLQVLPTNSRPVTTWRNRDKALLMIAQGIELVVREWLKKGDISVPSRPLDSPKDTYSAVDGNGVMAAREQIIYTPPGVKTLSVKRWDIFISYASEDRDSIALPLAEALTRAGLKVWLDKQELRLGDSLREKIDEGLVESSFGVVILSPDFLGKSWPRKELNGLMAIEQNGQKVLLPVWHNITKATLIQYSPILADRLGTNTERGIDNVTNEILKVVFYPGSETPSVLSPTIGRRFIELLDSTTDILKIKAFLTTHPKIVLEALGTPNIAETHIQWLLRLDDFELDLCVGKYQATTGRREWSILLFETLSNQLFEAESRPVSSLVKSVAQLESFREYVQQNLKRTRNKLPDINPNFQATVVAGRRKQMGQATIDHLREYNDYLFGIQVRTYDWLISAAIAVSAGT